jgi:uncharacterized coiled-coil protein SlyX
MSEQVIPGHARMIAERLFTNGQNKRAARLVLELQDKTNGGGWSINAAYDQIKQVTEPIEAKVAEQADTIAELKRQRTELLTGWHKTEMDLKAIIERLTKERDFAQCQVGEQTTWKWIETSEMTPPSRLRVAIIVEDETLYIRRLVTAGYYRSESSGWWYGTPGDYRSCRDQRWTVTHWAFLPPLLPKSTPTGDTI